MSVSDSLLQRAYELDLPQYGVDELVFMADTVERARPDLIVEWGTNVGASARVFYETVASLDLGCVVHTVELPPERANKDRDHPGLRLGECLGEPTVLQDGTTWYLDGKVVQHYGDGLATALWLCQEFGTARPLVYLDGDHSYAQVLTELRTLRMALPEAVLLLHDTDHLSSVSSALDDFRPERYYEVEHIRSQAGMKALWPVQLA